MFLSSLNCFYHQKYSHYLQIKHNREFLSQREREISPQSWFFWFCHNLRKLAKVEEKFINKKIKMCYKCEYVKTSPIICFRMSFF
jgi:hypothetical protein